MEVSGGSQSLNAVNPMRMLPYSVVYEIQAPGWLSGNCMNCSIIDSALSIFHEGFRHFVPYGFLKSASCVRLFDDMPVFTGMNTLTAPQKAWPLRQPCRWTAESH